MGFESGQLDLRTHQLCYSVPREMASEKSRALACVQFVSGCVRSDLHNCGVLPQRLSHPHERRWTQQSVVRCARARVRILTGKGSRAE